MLVGELDDLDVARRQVHFGRDALIAPFHRVDARIAGVARPAGRKCQRRDTIAVIVTARTAELDVAQRAIPIDVDLGEIVGQTELDVVVLADRPAHAQPTAHRTSLIAGYVVAFRGIEGAVVKVVAERDAIDRIVRIGEGERGGAFRLAGVELQAQRLAAAEDVVLRDRAREHDAIRARKARADHQVARGLFLDGEIDVDLVGGAGHWLSLYLHVVEVAQTVDALLGLVDLLGVVPLALHLPHLAADHFVAGAHVAAHVDAMHVGTPARIDEDGESHLTLLAIDLGGGVDVGKGVAFVAEPVGYRLHRGIELLAREDVAGLELGELAVFLFRQNEIAGKAHRRNGVALPFLDRDRNVDVLLVRSDRHRSRLDLEIEVSLVHVE